MVWETLEHFRRLPLNDDDVNCLCIVLSVASLFRLPTSIAACDEKAESTIIRWRHVSPSAVNFASTPEDYIYRTSDYVHRHAIFPSVKGLWNPNQSGMGNVMLIITKLVKANLTEWIGPVTSETRVDRDNKPREAYMASARLFPDDPDNPDNPGNIDRRETMKSLAHMLLGIEQSAGTQNMGDTCHMSHERTLSASRK